MQQEQNQGAQPQKKVLVAAVTSVDYSGGLIGLFMDNRKKLQNSIQASNNQGFRFRSVLPPKQTVFSLLIQIICLSLTLFLWCPIRGETLVFEK